MLLHIAFISIMVLTAVFLAVFRDAAVSDFRELVQTEDTVHGSNEYAKLPCYLQMYFSSKALSDKGYGVDIKTL